ncbi:MAG: DMT family transporter [Verrucomicrobia bacterium]|nr:DMT family transporter [Verrucomicrobiota bacterium]
MTAAVPNSSEAQRLKAAQMLLLATAGWGISFPAMKALALAQEQLLPGCGSLFIAALCVVYRFGFAALVMLAVSARTVRSLTRDELAHGLGVGLFGGAGILIQMDGLAHTAASTSAFLTQCYVLVLPLWVAVRDRRPPGARVLAGCALVVAGVAVLARMDWENFRLGRGELETIVASFIFTGQILWLERPRFAACRVNHTSLVMFAVMALAGLPAALATARAPGDWLRAYSTAPTLGFLAILVGFCTLGSYVLMNRWQRHVGATVAGLIYCVEPVFASAFALFVPAWFSAWAGVDYGNETLTKNLLLGGGLILAANVLVQFKLPERAEKKSKGAAAS